MLHVANKWFDYTTCGQGVIHIWEAHVSSQLRCNIWLVQGRDRDILIDTGTGLASLVEEISQIVEKKTIAVATHTHFDHIGSHHEFRHRAVHPAEAGIMRVPTRANTLIDDYMTDELLSAIPSQDYASEKYTIAPAPPTLLLEEGDVIDLGNRAFDVLHLPGHSPGSIGLWEKRTGILFSGDAVYDGPLFDNLYHSDIDAYLNTMLRLREIPVDVVYGGHHAIFGSERFVEIIDSYLLDKGFGE